MLPSPQLPRKNLLDVGKLSTFNDATDVSLALWTFSLFRNIELQSFDTFDIELHGIFVINIGTSKNLYVFWWLWLCMNCMEIISHLATKIKIHFFKYNRME